MYKTYRFWLDDLRTPKSNDWKVCRSVESFQFFFAQHYQKQEELTQVRLTLALDNDSGLTKSKELRKEFRTVLDWLFYEYNIIPSCIYILTSNPNAEIWIKDWCKSIEKIFGYEITVKGSLSNYINQQRLEKINSLTF